MTGPGDLGAALVPRVPDGWTVAPGLIDLQVNGYAGAEVGGDPDEIAAVARALPATGVTAWCPTLVTRSERAYSHAARALATTPWPRVGARFLGAHLEGPFLSPSRAGAHPPGRMRHPTPAAVDRLVGLFSPRIVTLAPELPGALDAVRRLTRRGVLVACGHTEAACDEASAAIDAGARLLTHALNAMPGMSARGPGPAGAFLAHRSARVSLIADGIHVAPEMCAMLARAAGSRLVLVSDATAATDAPPGRYRLGERRIDWDGARATTGGLLAGGAAPLWRGVATLIACGIPLRRALAAATVAPRRLLGLPATAFPGHLVVMDPDLVPRLTLVDGLVAFADPALPFDVPEIGKPFLA
jgi:N-acetylglucosamine-6-phosphate deacetylase